MSLHEDLVEAARGWLLARRCTVVITEMVSGAGETPDAIGWNSFRSMLVECKASRSDFLADRHKATRRYEDLGMGNERYYLAPAGLIRKEDLPAGWGLLEVNGEGKVRMRANAEPRRGSRDNEMALLVSAIRRIGQTPPRGISVKVYTIETERRATISIEPEPTQSKDPV